LIALLVSAAAAGLAQNAAPQVPASRAVPNLINYSGVLNGPNGQPLTAFTGVTFLLYAGPQGGSPLWMETHNVVPGVDGQYTVTLGSTRNEGLPADLFASGEARWLAVQVEGQPEQPRILLVAVPYALKAADAQTIGGFPPSAFLRAPPATGNGPAPMTAANPTANTRPAATSNVTTSGGSVNALPLWTTGTSIQSSVISQSGSGSTAKIGIHTTTPTAALDVKGDTTIGGLLSLPAISNATPTAGGTSQPLDFVASSFNTSTHAAVKQTFQWRAEPTGNNTASPSGAMHLLFGSGTSSPAGTGLRISSAGVLTFAAGQSFPGAGTITGITTAAGSGLAGGGIGGTLTLGLTTTCATNQVLHWNGTKWVCSSAGSGTVTSVNSGAGLTGGPISGIGTLSIAAAGVSNTMLAHSSLTVSAGAGLTGGGAVSLGAATTLRLDTTKVPLLSANNTFVGNQTVTGGLKVSGAVTGLLANFGGNTSVGLQSLTFNAGGVGVFGYALGSDTGGTGVFGESDQGSGTGVLGNGAIGVKGVATVCCTGPGGSFTGANGSTTNSTPGVTVTGGSGGQGGPYGGGDGLQAQGGNGGGCDSNFNCGAGGAGVRAIGGSGKEGIGGAGLGVGGFFIGGSGTDCSGSGCGGDGIDAFPGVGPGNNPDGLGGNFIGDVIVLGTLSADAKNFKIDHPLDPASKYLVHASIESSEMMNVYSGNVTTDAQGESIVQLPGWFEALNRDFRYQLTVIGQFAEAIIARKIENHQFTIRTNAPNVEVSWQVTGVRQDAFAKAHPLVVEEEKPDRLQGFYIHPELHGAPTEKQIEWARHPQLMKWLKEEREKQVARTATAKAR
jgi:hypothetical protein